jgi:hypothetical protein
MWPAAETCDGTPHDAGSLAAEALRLRRRGMNEARAFEDQCLLFRP